jgi:hypothetical protein
VNLPTHQIEEDCIWICGEKIEKFSKITQKKKIKIYEYHRKKVAQIGKKQKRIETIRKKEIPENIIMKNMENYLENMKPNYNFAEQ